MSPRCISRKPSKQQRWCCIQETPTHDVGTPGDSSPHRTPAPSPLHIRFSALLNCHEIDKIINLHREVKVGALRDLDIGFLKLHKKQDEDVKVEDVTGHFFKVKVK